MCELLQISISDCYFQKHEAVVSNTQATHVTASQIPASLWAASRTAITCQHSCQQRGRTQVSQLTQKAPGTEPEANSKQVRQLIYITGIKAR